jgi:hypothetical protein
MTVPTVMRHDQLALLNRQRCQASVRVAWISADGKTGSSHMRIIVVFSGRIRWGHRATPVLLKDVDAETIKHARFAPSATKRAPLSRDTYPRLDFDLLLLRWRRYGRSG